MSNTKQNYAKRLHGYILLVLFKFRMDIPVTFYLPNRCNNRHYLIL